MIGLNTDVSSMTAAPGGVDVGVGVGVGALVGVAVGAGVGVGIGVGVAFSTLTGRKAVLNPSNTWTLADNPGMSGVTVSVALAPLPETDDDTADPATPVVNVPTWLGSLIATIAGVALTFAKISELGLSVRGPTPTEVGVAVGVGVGDGGNVGVGVGDGDNVGVGDGVGVAEPTVAISDTPSPYLSYAETIETP
jgi:hypothetical protein